MKKILFTLLVTVALLLGISTKISAQPTPIAPAGSGTEADPWQIATLANLYWIAATDAVVPSPTLATRCHYKYYIQTADIDASSTATWFPNGSGGYYGWDPIGWIVNDFYYQAFKSRYNGQGFKINGLYINRPGEEAIGLFGYIKVSQISNIGLTNVNITGGSLSVGGLVGNCDGLVVRNSYVTGSVTGTGQGVGGLVGQASMGEAQNVFSTANVTGNDLVGGLYGYYGGEWVKIFENSYSTGIVTGLGRVGGILGEVIGDWEKIYFAGSSNGGAMVGIGEMGGWHFP